FVADRPPDLSAAQRPLALALQPDYLFLQTPHSWKRPHHLWKSRNLSKPPNLSPLQPARSFQLSFCSWRQISPPAPQFARAPLHPSEKPAAKSGKESSPPARCRRSATPDCNAQAFGPSLN